MIKVLSAFFGLWAAAMIILTACSDNKQVTGTDFPNTITGIVQDSTEAPVPDLMVRLIRQRSPEYIGTDYENYLFDTTFTDSEGAFRFEDVEQGIYDIEGRRESVIIAYRQGVTKDEEELTLDPLIISGPGSITGTVDLPPGVDLEVYVELQGTHYFVKVDSAGDFLLPLLPVGDFEIDVVQFKSEMGIRNTIATSQVTVVSREMAEASLLQVPMDSLWDYSTVITLNTTATGADVAGDVYNFPALIRLNADNFDFSQARSDGGDIRLVNQSATHLPFEIERWDSAGQKAEIWVGIDTISGNSQQNLVLYWGSSSAQNLSNGAAVFDTASSFLAVWHYGDDPSDPPPQIKDATYHGSHGTAFEDVAADKSVEANIGRGLFFNDDPGYIRMDDVCPLISDGDALTFSAWFKAGDHSKTYFIAGGIDTEDSNVFRVGLETDGTIKLATHRNFENYGDSYEDDVWHLVSASIDALGNRKVYVDAVEIPGYVTIDPPPYSSMTNLVSGIEWDGGNTSDRFDGIMDELRMSLTVRNEDWIKLNYENQKQNQTLVEF